MKASVWVALAALPMAAAALPAPPPPLPPPPPELRYELRGYAVDRVFSGYRRYATDYVRERFEQDSGRILQNAAESIEPEGRIDPHRIINFNVTGMNGLLVKGRVLRRCLDDEKSQCNWHYAQAIRDTRAIDEADFDPAEAIEKLQSAGIAPNPTTKYPPSILEIIGPDENRLMEQAIQPFATNSRSCPELLAFDNFWNEIPELAADDLDTRGEAGPYSGGVHHGPWLQIAFEDYLSQYTVRSGFDQPEAVGMTYNLIAEVLKNCGGENWPSY